jgi:DNA-3-methyladenine glycosylase II
MPFSAVIPVTPPFDFDLTLRYLQTSPSTVVERADGRSWQRAVRLEGKPFLLQVSSSGSPAALQLGVEVLGGEPSPSQGAAAVALVRRLFDADAQADQFYALAAADPVFWPVAARWRGLRPVLIADPFETLVWAIIGQQINVRFAARLKQALVEEYGGSLTIGGQRFPLFPEPAALAAASPARLRALQFSRQKADYILGVAAAAASGALDFAALGALPPEAALPELMALRGIGRWTAE